jgi:hypothetical protein
MRQYQMGLRRLFAMLIRRARSGIGGNVITKA